MRKLLYVPMIHEIAHHTRHIQATCKPGLRSYIILWTQYFDNRVLPLYWRGVKEFLGAISVSKVYHEGVCSKGDGSHVEVFD